MKKLECFTGKKGIEIVSYDVEGGTGYCCCMLPAEEFPEEVGLCWFKKGKLMMSEVFTTLEAAKVGGKLVYAATLIIYKKEEKKK